VEEIMYHVNFDQFKYRDQELRRQADHQRLVRSLTKASQRNLNFREAIGKALIRSGQYLLKPAQAVQ
jgi:hypothetical protein